MYRVTLALAVVGDNYTHDTSNADLKFFLDTELYWNQAFAGIAAFTILSNAFLVVTFWISDTNNPASVVIAGGIVSYFCINP
jgi:hypothetical protein